LAQVVAFKYYSTFSGLVVVKLFLKISILKNFLLEMLKFKEITTERKIQKSMKTLELLASGESAIGEEISKTQHLKLNNISLSGNLFKHYVPPFL
jgi:hypothetical protein